MFLERNHDGGEVTVRFSHDDFSRLVSRAADYGTTPEGLVERLAREAYGRATAAPRRSGESPDPA